MTRLIGISGSLREGSLNTALLRTATELVPDGAELDVVTLEDIPFYDGDVEREIGFPRAVQRLRDRVAAADALVLASPEYNWSTTGVLKNTIDWLSRRPDPPLSALPTLLISAAGRSGGARAQAHLRDILGHNRVDVLDDTLQVSGARDHVVDGQLVTAGHRERLGRLLEALVDRTSALGEAA